MAISVHTNYANLVTQNTLQSTNNALSKSMERLSTGFRINSAADDAAGLQIANRLEAQSRGMSVAMRNAQDGISMLQTAEGAMDEMTNIAYRMNDLATQAANGTNSQEDRDALDGEYQALAKQLGDIMSNTTFGGTKLLVDEGLATPAVSPAPGGISLQIGSTSSETLQVDVSTQLKALSDVAIVGASHGFGDLKSADNAGAAIKLISEGTPAKAAEVGPPAVPATPAVPSFISNLGAARSSLGAQINNLNHTMTNLGNMTENVEAAKGRIMDTDFAAESGNMSKNQMLMQSGAQMLSATKMTPQLAMSMLG
ncbi:MAG: lateral flagellin LafA [Vibrio sp.]